MANFHLTPAALRSLTEIGRYTEINYGIKQRDKYLGAIDQKFHYLSKNPTAGRIRDEVKPGIRSLHEGRHVIFYLQKGKRIIIVDILHERMDPALHL
jgi:toxin ParE1/3/4